MCRDQPMVRYDAQHERNLTLLCPQVAESQRGNSYSQIISSLFWSVRKEFLVLAPHEVTSSNPSPIRRTLAELQPQFNKVAGFKRTW